MQIHRKNNSEGNISSLRREHLIPVHFIHTRLFQKGAFHHSEGSIQFHLKITKISVNFVQSFKIISQNAKISVNKSIVTNFFIFYWKDIGKKQWIIILLNTLKRSEGSIWSYSGNPTCLVGYRYEFFWKGAFGHTVEILRPWQGNTFKIFRREHLGMQNFQKGAFRPKLFMCTCDTKN